MADFLAEMQNEIASRIAKLEPAVAEHRRLQDAAAALTKLNGSATGAGQTRGRGRPRGTTKRAAAKRTSSAKAPKAASRGRGGRPKGSGTRAAQALALVQEQPGITIAQLAEKMGISKTYLYRVLPGLQKDGKITNQGRGWHPKK
jgi:CRP-like cAMP-binding protein